MLGRSPTHRLDDSPKAGPEEGEIRHTQSVRVLYSFPHPLGRPGVGTTALHQVRGLAAQGADVQVVCPSCSVDPGPGVDVVELMRLGGRRVPLRGIGVERAWRLHDRRVARLIGRDRRPADVVHTWPLGALESLEAARARNILGAREVPNTHTATAYSEAAVEAFTTGVRAQRGESHAYNPTRLAREEAEYQAAGVLLVPSDAVAASFLDRGVPEARLGRHQYGYDPDTFWSADRDGGPFSAVIVGRGEPRKGLHYALQAWRDSGAGEHGSLTLYGEIGGSYRTFLKPLLAAPGVRVSGFATDVASVMRSADALILASVEEGSALVTYEAQASGCVLLVSSATGARVRHGEDGLVHAPRDVSTLTQQLTSVITDEALRERLRAASLEAARELTWADAGRRLLQVYESRLRRPA